MSKKLSFGFQIVQFKDRFEVQERVMSFVGMPTAIRVKRREADTLAKARVLKNELELEEGRVIE